jgi:hypothetical protein
MLGNQGQSRVSRARGWPVSLSACLLQTSGDWPARDDRYRSRRSRTVRPTSALRPSGVSNVDVSVRGHNDCQNMSHRPFSARLH